MQNKQHLHNRHQDCFKSNKSFGKNTRTNNQMTKIQLRKIFTQANNKLHLKYPKKVVYLHQLKETQK